MKKIKMGIVGHGFVGKAVDYGFETPFVEKFYVDPKYETTIDDLLKWGPQVTFICVPTPMAPNGSIDDTMVLDAVYKLIAHNDGGIVIKSTITPDTIHRILVKCTTLEKQKRLVVNPEFLTEKNAEEQFVNPAFQVLGGHPEASAAVLDLYKHYSMINKCEFHMVGAIEASLIKYAINSFLAMKVTFFNQLYDVTIDEGANFNTLVRAMAADPRIGNSHMKVPGYDKKRGYGGACFPKDVRAFTKYTKRLTLLEECDKINNSYRQRYLKDEREVMNNVNYGQTKEEQ